MLFETERLTLREATTADAPFFLTLMNEAGWLKFISNHEIRTSDQVVEFIETKILPAYTAHGVGLWLVEIKKENRPIGICGFVDRDSLDEADIGFAFLERFGGQGYASEAAEGCLNFAKSQLPNDNILAIVLPENLRSVKLLKKLGFKLKSDFSHPGSEEKLDLYTIENR